MIKRNLLLHLIIVIWGNSIIAKEHEFKIRGTLPWHNFLSGPTTWDENDYEAYLDQMKKLNLNLIALHCYTGGAERYVHHFTLEQHRALAQRYHKGHKVFLIFLLSL